MIIPDRKKTVSVILSKMHPDGSSEVDQNEPESGFHKEPSMEILQGIAADLMHGLKIGSEKAVALALKAAVEACDMDSEE